MVLARIHHHALLALDLTLNNIPLKDLWSPLAAFVAAVVTASVAFIGILVTFVAGVQQRRLEREKAIKQWIVDDGFKIGQRHLADFMRVLSTNSIAKLRDFMLNQAYSPEIEMLAMLYSTNWLISYNFIVNRLQTEIREGRVEQLGALKTDLAIIQWKICSVCEWQMRNLSATIKKRQKIAAKFC